MEAKLKHLELIQNVVNRMARNSFLIKGWTITLISAIFVLSETNRNNNFVFLALLPAVAFWGLDAYYLKQERLFRRLYDNVRITASDQIDFSMNTSKYMEQNIIRIMFSISEFWFHGVITLIVISGFFLIPLLK